MSRPSFAARRALLRAAFGGGLALAALGASSRAAAQGGARMDPAEREQLRRALRERGDWQPGGNGQRRGQGDAGRGRADRDSDRQRRLSEDERRQLREQLRERGRRHPR